MNDDLNTAYHNLEKEIKVIEKTKETLADSFFDVFDKYVYSTNNINIFGRTKLKFENYKIVRRHHNGNYIEWYSLKIFYNKKLIFKATKEINYSGFIKIKNIDLDKLLELQDCYNKLVNITISSIEEEKNRIEELNNFNLALEELLI